MPIYSFKARNKKGKVIEDTVQAQNREEAADSIKSEGLEILSVKNIDAKVDTLLSPSISVSDKAALCRFLATMLRAGMSLPEAADIIGRESESKRLKKILMDISFQTRKGSSLSSVLSKYPKDFDAVFLTMIKAGEGSGTLDQSFDYLAKQLLASYEVSQKVKGAMVYPAVIIVAMIGNGIVMLTFVLPKISEAFSQLNLDLPTLTRMIFAFGNFINDNTLLVLGIMIILLIIVFLVLYIRTTRKMVISIISKLPVVSKLFNEIDVSRFARTLSTMLQSGVPIMEALDVSAGVLSQPSLKKEASKFSASVAKGEALSDILEGIKGVFPSVMTQTIRAGEKSGTLEVILQELAEFYEKEVDYSLKRLTALLEPLLMLVIGIAVGAMLLMMVVPIYSIVGNLEGSF